MSEKPGSIVPMGITILQRDKTGNIRAMIPNVTKNSIVPEGKDNEDGEHLEKSGKDLDEESTAQNFLNIVQQGDISSRQTEKVKSATKGRKK